MSEEIEARVIDRGAPTSLSVPEPGLTGNNQAVAEWMASPFTGDRDGEVAETPSMVAERLGISRQRVNEIKRKPDVIAESRRLIQMSVDTEKLPAVWAKILEAAAEDPTGFGWTVGQRLLDLGYGPFGAPSAPPQSSSALPGAGGGYEAMVLVRKTA